MKNTVCMASPGNRTALLAEVMHVDLAIIRWGDALPDTFPMRKTQQMEGNRRLFLDDIFSFSRDSL